MNTIAQTNIKYETPPIDEIVCGMRFNSIKELRSVHFGILWQKFKADFPKVEDQILVTPVPSEELKNPDRPRLPRVWFIKKNDNELVQIQRNRFLHNWRKRQPDNEYPGYGKVIENFERYLSRFQEFLVEENLGNLVVRQYELTYIDLISKGQGWHNLGDLKKVFPNLVSLTGQSILSTDVRDINWQTLLGLSNNLGQVKLAIRTAERVSDKQALLHIEFNAHSDGPYEPMRGWFDAAHNEIIKLFSDLVSDEIQDNLWGRRPC